MNAPPLVTVLLPVYNAAPFLQAALDSIFNQTFGNFEVLAIDDASTDGSAEILSSCTDPRLRRITHLHNQGLIASLNEGLDAAQGTFIARMDADDRMLPLRLERQVAFLNDNPEVALVAAFVETINSEGCTDGAWDLDRATPDEAHVAAMLPRTNCLAHPTVMLRRGAMGNLRYDPRQHGAEDWDLWLRMRSRGLRLAKLPEVLLQYRQHGTSIMDAQKRRIPYERRLLRARGTFLAGEWAKLRFSTFHLAVLKAQLRTLARHLRNNAGLPLIRDAKRLITYSPAGLLREHRALAKAERNWRGSHLLLFPYLHTGGAEQVHADITAAIADHNPLVVICGFSTNRAMEPAFNRHGYLLELPRLLHHPFMRRKTHRRLARLINGANQPVVLSSLTSNFFTLLPLLNPGVRTFHLQHAFLYQPAGNALHKQWLPFFPQVSGYLFVSVHAKVEFEHFLFANHVPRSQFGKLEFMPNAVHRFGNVEKHGKTGLLFVGRSSPEKRLDLFLDLCLALEQKAPGHYRFTVAGPIPLPGHPYVAFEGSVNDEGRMAGIYAANDLLVLTSDREGFPLVVMEAMAHGLGIVATPVGDVPGRLDGTCAVLTSTVEAARALREMEAAIVALDADRPRLQAMKAAALAQARKEFAPEAFKARYRALLISPAP